MASNLQFLPIEIQTSIAELRALGTPDHALHLLVDRILRASEAKTTSLQMDIVRIEDAITLRLDRLGEKLAADMRTQHGASNQMLADIRTLAQQQETATAQLRAEFQSVGEQLNDIDIWRAEVDQERKSFRQSRDQSLDQRTRTEQAVQELADQFKAFTAHIDQLIAQGPTPEQAQAYRAFLDELMRERGADT